MFSQFLYLYIGKNWGFIMAVNAINKIGNLYNVNKIQHAQARYVNNAGGVYSVKDREFHPEVSSTEFGKTPLANRLDLLA